VDTLHIWFKSTADFTKKQLLHISFCRDNGKTAFFLFCTLRLGMISVSPWDLYSKQTSSQSFSREKKKALNKKNFHSNLG
jgi:hypothetical protein